jgi:hypothetical protein
MLRTVLDRHITPTMLSFTPTQGPYQDTNQYPNQYPVTIPFDTFSPSYQNKNEVSSKAIPMSPS